LIDKLNIKWRIKTTLLQIWLMWRRM